MPPFILLLLKILPYLPDLVRTVESIFGGEPGQGPTKLQAAVGLLQAVVPEVVTHLQNEPAGKSKLESLIGTVVAGINAADSWKTGQDQPPPP